MENILGESEKNYYLNLREFKDGSFEGIVKAVRPMQKELIEASMNGTLFNCPLPSYREKETDPEALEYDRIQNHRRAVRRAKQNIRWLCKEMGVDRLFTLTYRENVEDREKVKSDFKEFIRLARKRYPGLLYVSVLEKQERGALHLHFATKGYLSIEFLTACWHKALGFKTVQHGEASPGSANVAYRKSRWGRANPVWKTAKLAGYITKYLGKTFDETTTEKRRYWHAKAASVPNKQRFWVSGNNIIEAIRSARSLLRFHVGLQYGADMWISDLEDCFWIAGWGDTR